MAKGTTVTDMSRRTDLAGQSVVQKTAAGDFTVTYNENGYATSAKNNNYDSATSTWKNTTGGLSGGGSKDSRIDAVEDGRNTALNNVNSTYGDMIGQVDSFYQDQIDAVGAYADKQAQIQQERTDFAIEQIEQQKDQAQKDYTKEQSGAYVDWQKQSNQYGVNAEQMAAQGMTNTGYSESSQVSMYNTYQNRLATARESYNQAILNYNNAIKDAQLQNNAALAEIAYNALQTQLELSLEGFQYKNSLIQEQTKLNLEIDNQYWGRYTDVLDQINTENALAEEIRQYNEKMAEEKRQYNESLALEKAQLEEQKRQFNVQQAAKKASSSGGGSISKSSSSGGSSSSKSSGSSASVSKSKGETNRNSGKTASKSKSSATIDMNSVLALGYGPISAARLNELEEQGLIQSYQSGNKIKFKKSAYSIKQSMLLK